MWSEKQKVLFAFQRLVNPACIMFKGFDVICSKIERILIERNYDSR